MDHRVYTQRSASKAPPWELLREQVLARDEYRCLECRESTASTELHVHHLLPRSAGGEDEFANLVTLCAGCHAARHPLLSAGLTRRVIEGWAVRLAKWLDRQRIIPKDAVGFGPALRLFGWKRFRDGQLPVIQAVLAGHSVLVVSPTGFGKTLCFQLPAILRKNVTVVITPLKALMGNQVAGLLSKKIPSTFINSDLSRDERHLRYEFLSHNGFKLLYLAPERFFVRNERELQQLKRLRPAFLVIDEVHCVDQWGRDFRPEYGRLKEVRERLGSPPVLAFTATAGLDMQKRILNSLGVPNARIFVRGVDRPNITLLRWEQSSASRSAAICQTCALHERIGGKMMIFVPTVKIGEALQRQLAAQGHDIPFYHSKYGTPWDRDQLVQRFVGQIAPGIDCIICTNAFGMGLDVPNVRLVVHWQPPASMEDYMQEFGRAGRDGNPAAAILFHDGSSQDWKLLDYMAARSASGPHLDAARSAALAHRKQQIRAMARVAAQSSCFRQALITYFESPAPKLRRSLSERIISWVFSQGLQGIHHRSPGISSINRMGQIGKIKVVEGGDSLQFMPSKYPANAPIYATSSTGTHSF